MIFDYEGVLKEIKRKKLSKEDAIKLIRKKVRENKGSKIPSLNEVLMHGEKRMGFMTKPSRSISGVAVVAVMSKPIPCPHGKCIMCPGGVDSCFGDMPQSYTGNEPATLRGIRNKFDPYLQVFNRLEQYVVLEHMPEKIELIIMGGTFPSFDKRYQKNFVGCCLKAMNDFGKMFFNKGVLNLKKFKEFFEIPCDVNDDERMKRLHKKILSLKGKVGLEQKRNEKGLIRCVGMTVETRPDSFDANFLLSLGVTRIELGVQSVYDSVLDRIERGHSVEDVISATKILKNKGFKINYHYMVGLPGSSVAKDLNGFKKLFSDSRFRPDMLKIYPCVVIKGTKVYDLWKKGKFKPIEFNSAVKLINKMKKFVPYYVRVMRIQRDIPEKVICAGVKKSNLRQYLDKCKCIRCREVGRVGSKIDKVKLFVEKYNASDGLEYFISLEDVNRNSIIGFCRLRVVNNIGFIRELHVYSSSVKIGLKGKGLEMQHKGYGKKLLLEAERIAKGKVSKLLVISGIGVREYYRKFGYKKDGYYMGKKLN